jgi:hypothetical protein
MDAVVKRELRNAYTILIVKSEGERSSGIPRRT